MFTDCTGGNGSFGGNGFPFGGGVGTASGTFTNCTGGVRAFGGNGGNADGVFNSCIGGADSFGAPGGNLGGKLYYCRLTSGLFETVSGSGRTVLCIDGSNNQNNQ